MNGNAMSSMSPPAPYTMTGTIALDDTGVTEPDVRGPVTDTDGTPLADTGGVRALAVPGALLAGVSAENALLRTTAENANRATVDTAPMTATYRGILRFTGGE